MRKPQQRTLLAILIIALIGVLVMLRATRFGIGITPDSTVYMAAAQNLSHGLGFNVLSDHSGELIPLTHYPPLYPALLALGEESGISLPTIARHLNAILFGANIGLVGLCVWWYARDSFWLPVLGGLLTLTAVDLAAAHSYALTEPLFIFFALSGLLCLALYFEEQRRRFLIAAGSAMALAALTRYVGIVSLATGVLVLLTFSGARSSPARRSLGRRLADVFLFGAIACLPSAIWAVRNRLETGGATERQIAFHPVKVQQLAASISTIAQWLLLGKVPARLRAIAFMIEAAILIAFGFYLWRRGRHVSRDSNQIAASMLPSILAIFIALYVAFLIFTASFIDADTVFDNRSLAPVHVAGIVLMLCIARQLYNKSDSRSARIALVVFAALLATSQSFRVVGWMIRTSQDGQGYASRAWLGSQTISAVKQLPSGMPIYSNGQDALFYLTGRPAFSIPEKIIHGTGRQNPNYDHEVEKMKNDIRDHDAVLVYFYTFPERSYLAAEDDLRRRLPFEIYARADGLIVAGHRLPELN